MNKRTAVITDEQYNNLVSMIHHGSKGIRKNEGMAVALIVTGNCGLRIGDCLSLTMSSFSKHGNDHVFNIHEEKTGKARTTIIPDEVYNILKDYARERGVADDEPIFDFKVRGLQKKLNRAASICGYENVGTHSMRKMCATKLYDASGHDIEMVRRYLNHSSVTTTTHYLGVDQEETNNLVKKNCTIPI